MNISEQLEEIEIETSEREWVEVSFSLDPASLPRPAQSSSDDGISSTGAPVEREEPILRQDSTTT